jgi:spermidine synthase/MFS family permease
MKGRLLRVALLLFGSGMTALVYQVAWMRELRLVFGFSTAATAAVLAIFMGGLGVGGWLLGRRADAAPRPLAFYGKLELLIAGSAALTPLWVFLVRLAYVALGGTQTLGLIGGTLARLILSFLVLSVPTVLMGGTLPAATRAVATAEDRRRRFLAILYGTNTLGAVAGTVLSDFLLLEHLGTRLTLWVACLVNALVGLAAVRLAGPVAVDEIRDAGSEMRDEKGSDPASRIPHPASQPGETRKQRREAQRQKKSEESSAVLDASGAGLPPRGFVLASAAVVGFAFFLMELVWYRMLAPLLGGSTYTFGLILAVALVGIGAGSAAYSLTRRATAATLSGFAASCALEALCLVIPWALGDRIALLAVFLRPMGAFGFSGYVAGWSLVAAVVVFPAALVAGFQFPLLIALLGEGRDHVGSDVGLAYAWNTAGGIAGSLAGGFGLLPLLTATGTWVFSAGLLVALGLCALLLSLRSAHGRAQVWLAGGAATASVIVLLAATGPTAAWRHSPIGAGRVDLGKASPNSVEDWLRERRRSLEWQQDGVESAVALRKAGDGYAFVISGKIDGSSRGDAATQVMSGLIGAAVHGNPKRALVIGLGTGSTAGWLGLVPSIERVDVVELEPAILRVARDCAPVNGDVLHNPKVRVDVGDAREWLLTSREKYDLIFSEPSNPYRAGISSLFTEDFYRAARSRLAPGGIFLQWLQAYEVDSLTVQTVYATLSAAFPEVETWYTKQDDLILAATAEPIPYDAARIRERVAQEPFASAMEKAWRARGLEGFLSHYVARSSLSRALSADRGIPRNSDDRNVVEFAFARSLGRDSYFDVNEMRRVARARHEDTPPIAGDVDWLLVNRWRVSAATATAAKPVVRTDLSVDELRMTMAQRSFLEGRPEAVLSNWRLQPWQPVGSVEEVVLGEALAQGGDDQAMVLAERLRAVHPIEAEVLTARLRWRQGKNDEAVQALEKAFTLYRQDPWPMPILVKNAFAIVLDIASKDPAAAARLDAALSQPFSVALLDGERTLIRLELASRLDDARYASILSEMEPDVPWRTPILQQRAHAYQTTGNRLEQRARKELAEFLEREPPPFAPGVEASR